LSWSTDGPGGGLYYSYKCSPGAKKLILTFFSSTQQQLILSAPKVSALPHETLNNQFKLKHKYVTVSKNESKIPHSDVSRTSGWSALDYLNHIHIKLGSGKGGGRDM